MFRYCTDNREQEKSWLGEGSHSLAIRSFQRWMFYLPLDSIPASPSHDSFETLTTELGMRNSHPLINKSSNHKYLLQLEWLQVTT
jgi:hypothetical protein